MLTITVTDAGRAALLNAENTGTAPVTIAEVGISATAVAPSPSATTLTDEFKRLSTIAGDVVAPDTIHMIVRDESVDVYVVRSFALYLADGTLFAIYGQATPVVNKAAQSLMLLAVDVTFADIDAESLEFGDTNFLNPPATESVAGVAALATQAEAEAGTNSTKMMTPLRVLDAIAAQAPRRNLLINASGRINQRGYVSGTPTTAANQYTIDRWRVVVSGQSLVMEPFGSGVALTAPAGGVEQVIEGANIIGGTYTAGWNGAGTLKVNGVAVAKGATFELEAGVDATIRFTGGVFTFPQIELGERSTPLDLPTISQELLDCQRYYEAAAAGDVWFFNSSSSARFFARFNVPKRAAPTLKMGPGPLVAQYQSSTFASGLNEGLFNLVVTPTLRSSGFIADVTFDATTAGFANLWVHVFAAGAPYSIWTADAEI